MRSFLILAALSALPQCQSDETVRVLIAGRREVTGTEVSLYLGVFTHDDD